MPFWVCYYHAIWATKHRQPLIDSAIEPLILATIQRKSQALNVPILAINTVSDHIHVVVQIPPSLAAAEWIRHVKGLSAREVNDHFPDLAARFAWQKGYGLLAFGAKPLPTVIAYVEHQKEHHRDHQVQAYLEKTED